MCKAMTPSLNDVFVGFSIVVHQALVHENASACLPCDVISWNVVPTDIARKQAITIEGAHDFPGFKFAEIAIPEA
jgi:hypothetical protein